MAQPDPALGIAANFPTGAVRNGLLFAMQLGKPADTTLQGRFVKKSSGRRYYLGSTELTPGPQLRLDRDGRPLNPEVRVEQSPDTEVSVDMAIEIAQADTAEVPVGNFRPVKATVTLMEQEYQQINGSRELIFNGDRFGYAYELDANGLFDLTVHTLIFFAVDES